MYVVEELWFQAVIIPTLIVLIGAGFGWLAKPSVTQSGQESRMEATDIVPLGLSLCLAAMGVNTGLLTTQLLVGSIRKDLEQIIASQAGTALPSTLTAKIQSMPEVPTVVSIFLGALVIELVLLVLIALIMRYAKFGDLARAAISLPIGFFVLAITFVMWSAR